MMLLCLEVARSQHEEPRRVEVAWYGPALPQAGHLLKGVSGLLIEKQPEELGHRTTGLMASKRVRVSGHVLNVVWQNETRVQLQVLGDIDE